MNEFEFTNIVKAIRTYYPKETILPNDEAMTLWYDQLQDLDYKATAAGLKKWVAKERWSPSIADIREMAEQERRKKEIDIIFLRHRYMIQEHREHRIEDRGGDNE